MHLVPAHSLNRYRIILLMVLAACLSSLFSSAAASGEPINLMMPEARLESLMDEDDDGYVQSFKLFIKANTYIDEKGRRYSGGQHGHPSFAVRLQTAEGMVDSGIYRQPGRDDQNAFTLTFRRDEMKKSIQVMKERKEWDTVETMRQVLSGDLPIQSLQVLFLESDTHPEKDKRFLGQLKYDLDDDPRVTEETIQLDKPLYLESPANDRLAEVTIHSSPKGASVYLAGDEKGETPWSTMMPVDFYERNGRIEVRLDKEGYRSVNRKLAISPPDNREFTLPRLAEIAIDSDPRGAVVRIDGEKIGTTPVSSAFPAERELDIRIEKDQYQTQRFTNVHAPFDKTVQLALTEQAAETAVETAEQVAGARKGAIVSDGLQQPSPLQDLPQGGIGKISVDDGKENKDKEERDSSQAEADRSSSSRGSDRSASAGEADLVGVWQTTEGVLRLRRLGPYIVGDFGPHGIVLGRTDGNCMAGVLTSGGDAGIFRLTANQSGAVQGKLGMGGVSLEERWTGVRTAEAQTVEVQNLTGPANRSAWGRYSGTYESNQGTVQLLVQDGILIGDVGQEGILLGRWDGDSFAGTFTQGDRAGWFDFSFFTRDGAFRQGVRGWHGEDGETSWNLQRTSSEPPAPDNLEANVTCLD